MILEHQSIVVINGGVPVYAMIDCTWFYSRFSSLYPFFLDSFSTDKLEKTKRYDFW